MVSLELCQRPGRRRRLIHLPLRSAANLFRDPALLVLLVLGACVLGKKPNGAYLSDHPSNVPPHQRRGGLSDFLLL